MQKQGATLDAQSSVRLQQILSRLEELPNYTWDTDIAPFHSVRAPCTWTTLASGRPASHQTGANRRSPTTTGTSLADRSSPPNDPYHAVGAPATPSPPRTRPTRADPPSSETTSPPAATSASSPTSPRPPMSPPTVPSYVAFPPTLCAWSANTSSATS